MVQDDVPSARSRPRARELLRRLEGGLRPDRAAHQLRRLRGLGLWLFAMLDGWELRVRGGRRDVHPCRCYAVRQILLLVPLQRLQRVGRRLWRRFVQGHPAVDRSAPARNLQDRSRDGEPVFAPRQVVDCPPNIISESPSRRVVESIRTRSALPDFDTPHG